LIPDGGIRLIRLDQVTVMIEPEFEGRAEAIVRPHLSCNVPQYFFRTWVASGDLLPEQVVAWMYLVWAVCSAQWATDSSLVTRVALPLDHLGRIIGARSPNTVRRKIVEPVRDREPFSLFVRSATAFDPRRYSEIARATSGRAAGLPRNPGMLFTVAMTVPVHPKDVDDRLIASAPENRTVRWVLERAAQQAVSPETSKSAPSQDEPAPEQAPASDPGWASAALDWEAVRAGSGSARDFRLQVLAPLLAKIGTGTPLTVLEQFAPKLDPLVEKLGWRAAVTTLHRVAPRLPAVKWPLSYVRAAFEKEAATVRGPMVDLPASPPPVAGPRQVSEEKLTQFWAEYRASRGNVST
jgi:hypothetical protein